MTAPQNPTATTPSAPPSIDFLGAFRFLFNGGNTLNNILLGAVMNIIPIVGPIVLMGWYCEIIQRLIRRHPNPIPKLSFDDFVYFLGRGIAPFIVVLIATLPMILVMMALMFAGMFGGALFAGSIEHQGGDPAMMMIPVFGVVFLCFFAFIIVFNILMTAALIRAELTEDIGKSLDLGKIWSYARATWKDLLIAYLVFIPLSMLVMFGGMMVFFVGIYAAIVIINLAYLHLRWQVYERYLSRGGEAIPLQTKSGPLPSEQRPTVNPPSVPASK